MIKRSSLRRIFVSSIALFIVLISIYLFPQNEAKIPSKTIYRKAETSAIYLIDKNNYLARTIISVNSKNTEELAYELMEALINGSNKNKYLPNGFSSCIPSNTKINNISIDNDLVTVNFNSQLFTNENCNEEKIIELIVYTLTEIDGINNVKILIDGQNLLKLPYSKKIIPEKLNRSIGINRVSQFDSLRNTQEITAYFIGKNENTNYYIPITFITNDTSEKIEVIINELTGRDYFDNNLSTYISAGVQLKKYQILEDEITLNFNNDIFNGFDKIDEEVMYGIALSVYDNYNISTVSFEVNNKKIGAYALKNS